MEIEKPRIPIGGDRDVPKTYRVEIQTAHPDSVIGIIEQILPTGTYTIERRQAQVEVHFGEHRPSDDVLEALAGIKDAVGSVLHVSEEE